MCEKQRKSPEYMLQHKSKHLSVSIEIIFNFIHQAIKNNDK